MRLYVIQIKLYVETIIKKRDWLSIKAIGYHLLIINILRMPITRTLILPRVKLLSNLGINLGIIFA